MKLISEDSKHSYTNRGRLIEFPKWNKSYSLYLFLRSCAFLVDVLIPITTESVMIMIFGTGIATIMSISMAVVYMMLYNIFFMLLFNGKTLGMKLARIQAVHSSGFRTEKLNLMFRAILGSIYMIPVISWALVLANIISGCFFKGFTVIDFCSVTVVVRDSTFEKLKKIEDDFEKENTVTEMSDAKHYGVKKGEEYDNW